MWGADDNIYFVADPLPNEKTVKPGSPDVRLSVNNIYKIPAKGGQPVQVTKHADGSLFWPSMSSDGKTIVYEDDFGIWKLDVASGRINEIKIELGTDDKDNEIEFRQVSDEVDSFDISPSGRRAAISARGQILTIATERGDITRVNPDRMASRSQSPKWSADGKYIAFVSDRSGRDEVWISDPEGRSPKKITDLDNEKNAPIWSPDSKSLLYVAGGKKLYNYTVDDGKTTVVASNDIGRIGSVAVSPDSKWITVAKQDRTLRSHIYIAPIGGGEERHISDDALMFAENEAVWTADGQYILFTSTEGFSNGIATQGGITASTELWVLALRDRDRDPGNRDIDNEAQGLAAQAEARRNAGGNAAPEVRIDWSGLARRGKQLTVPGNAIGSLAPAPEGASVALTIGNRAAGGGGGGGQGGGGGEMYIINVESGQLTRVPRAPQQTGENAGGGNQGGGGGSAADRRSCSRATAARSTSVRDPGSTRRRSISMPIARPAAPPRRSGRGGNAAVEEPTGPNATARKVTYTANLEVDHKALRAQIFNEGWRIMKNRFYDANMHGTPWNEMRSIYAPLLDYLVDDEELHTVMMMMIGQLNASHTGVNGAPGDNRGSAQTRYPGFDLVADASGYYKVGRLYKDGPADKDYLKIKEGQFIIALDDRDLKTTDNYWQRFTYPLGQKFHFLLNDKPTRDRRMGSDDDAGQQPGVRRSAVRALGRRPRRDGREGEQRRDRLPPHPRDGCAVTAPVPARPRGQSHEEGARHRSALQRRRRHRSGAAQHPGRPPVSVHAGPRCRLPAGAPAELLRADGGDAERALRLRRRDVPGRLQAARSRQDGRRADDGRGDRHRIVHAARRHARSARPAAACGPLTAPTWRTTACRRTCTSTTLRRTSSRAATRRSRRRWKC